MRCYSITKDFDQNKIKEELGIEPKNYVLLFFGYVRKYKGLDLLIKAMPEIIRHKPSTTLMIVGEFYDEPKFYLDLINSLSLTDNIKVINDFVPNEEVEKYYRISDLVVLPYRSATQSGILNMAYGFNKPVLVTNVGGLAEFVEDGVTGYIVEPDHPEKLSKGILRFFEENDSINFEENIKNHIQLNSFGKIVQVFGQILNMKK